MVPPSLVVALLLLPEANGERREREKQRKREREREMEKERESNSEAQDQNTTHVEKPFELLTATVRCLRRQEVLRIDEACAMQPPFPCSTLPT